MGKCPTIARGGWARLELTDALSLLILLGEDASIYGRTNVTGEITCWPEFNKKLDYRLK